MRLLTPASGKSIASSASSAASSRQISIVSSGASFDNSNNNKILSNLFSAKNASSINSLSTQLSSLRLASSTSSDFFSSSSSSLASFHSSASADGAKKKPVLEVVRPVEEIPEKPKRPITTWLDFCATNRQTVRRAQPSLQNTEILRVLSEMWKRLSPTDKEKYEVRFRRRCQEYERDLEQWNASVSEAEKKSILIAQKEKQLAKEKSGIVAKQKRQQKALEAELGKPKKPLTTYFRFVQEQRRLRDKSGVVVNSKQFLKDVGEKYRLLPPSELERLLKTYNAEKKSYDVALEAWNKRMAQDGRSTMIGTRE